MPTRAHSCMGLVLESECDCKGRDVCVRAGTRFERLRALVGHIQLASGAVQCNGVCPTHCVSWECVLGRTLLAMGSHGQIRQEFHTPHASSPLPPSMLLIFFSRQLCLGPTCMGVQWAPQTMVQEMRNATLRAAEEPTRIWTPSTMYVACTHG